MPERDANAHAGRDDVGRSSKALGDARSPGGRAMAIVHHLRLAWRLGKVGRVERLLDELCELEIRRG